jgi:Protein of unknown function (DUF1091)
VEIKHGGGITPYYNTIINSTVEVCEFLNGTQNNPLMVWTFAAMEDSLPKGFIHPCPYSGHILLPNVTLAANTFTNQFLKGRYKGSTRLFDEIDDNILTFELVTEI